MFLCVAALSASGEIRTLTLRESLQMALSRNPDLQIARFEEQKASESVRIARDPFTPKLVVGSGLAYSSGFPMSIEGSSPSIVQARAIQSLYNRPLSFEVAAARENARGAAFDTAARRDEILHRTATLHLAAEGANRSLEMARQQLSSSEKIAIAVEARVAEGRELAIEGRAARLKIAQAQQRIRSLEAERDQTEANLALAVGLGQDDRVRPAGEERTPPPLPATEKESIEEALANSKQVKRLESAMQAKQLQIRGARSARYPKIDLVAQYGLLARFNNYEDFFRRFQRHNGQLGMSLQLPLFAGSASAGQAAQGELELARLRVELNATRDRVALDSRKAFEDMRTAESGRDLAKLDLDVTRERLGVALAQYEEGRTTMRQLEELRSAETEKWLAFYDAQQVVERARFDLLRKTGTLMAVTK